MTENIPILENELAQAALTWLRDRLPESWKVELSSRVELQPSPGEANVAVDLQGPNGVYTTMVVEAKRQFAPRDVDRLLSGIARTLRTLAGGSPILLVAPWLSRRTQELLAEQGVNYLDLTGNALVRLDQPTVYIQTQGAAKDPSPTPRGKARVTGPKAGRLIRYLVDVRPPHGVRELAEVTALAASYVSRLLETFDDEALIERSRRGRVEAVDIRRLIERWAENYDLFRTNRAQRYLAPRGAGQALRELSTSTLRVAVTGSFAAHRLAPVAAPTLLAIYADTRDAVARTLSLIPADQGANVALLTPFDPVVWERTSTDDEVTYVAVSQAAVDCLTGNGRMPAEGEALLRWMAENEKRWRLDTRPERMQL